MTESSSQFPDSRSHLQPSHQADELNIPGVSAGDRVRLVTLPPYVKTADPMPMLRPPTVLKQGEEGVVVKRRSADYWVVQFQSGTFLMEARYLQRCAETE